MKKSFFLLDAMFLFGAVAGAAFALSFAQRPGKKLRADLAAARAHGGGSAVRSVLADEARAIGADTVEMIADWLETLENPADPAAPARSDAAKKAWETRRKNAKKSAPAAGDLAEKISPVKKSSPKKSSPKTPAKKSIPKTPAKK